MNERGRRSIPAEIVEFRDAGTHIRHECVPTADITWWRSRAWRPAAPLGLVRHHDPTEIRVVLVAELRPDRDDQPTLDDRVVEIDRAVAGFR